MPDASDEIRKGQLITGQLNCWAEFAAAGRLSRNFTETHSFFRGESSKAEVAGWRLHAAGPGLVAWHGVGRGRGVQTPLARACTMEGGR